MSDATLACSGASFVANEWHDKYLELFGPKSEELGDDALGRGELATQAVDWVCTKGFDGACYVRGEFHSAEGCEHENTPADYEATKDVRAVCTKMKEHYGSLVINSYSAVASPFSFDIAQLSSGCESPQLYFAGQATHEL